MSRWGESKGTFIAIGDAAFALVIAPDCQGISWLLPTIRLLPVPSFSVRGAGFLQLGLLWSLAKQIRVLPIVAPNVSISFGILVVGLLNFGFQLLKASSDGFELLAVLLVKVEKGCWLSVSVKSTLSCLEDWDSKKLVILVHRLFE